MPVPFSCTKCGADLRGKPIAPADRGSYGGEEFFSRVIGLYSMKADTVAGWMCPDCGHAWPRNEPLPRGYRTFPTRS
jgi:predicted RNA-binding Zn-ribbon protein involved in translation (DUF1610 family)